MNERDIALKLSVRDDAVKMAGRNALELSKRFDVAGSSVEKFNRRLDQSAVFGKRGLGAVEAAAMKVVKPIDDVTRNVGRMEAMFNRVKTAGVAAMTSLGAAAAAAGQKAERAAASFGKMGKGAGGAGGRGMGGGMGGGVGMLGAKAMMIAHAAEGGADDFMNIMGDPEDFDETKGLFTPAFAKIADIGDMFNGRAAENKRQKKMAAAGESFKPEVQRYVEQMNQQRAAQFAPTRQADELARMEEQRRFGDDQGSLARAELGRAQRDVGRLTNYREIGTRGGEDLGKTLADNAEMNRQAIESQKSVLQLTQEAADADQRRLDLTKSRADAALQGSQQELDTARRIAETERSRFMTAQERFGQLSKFEQKEFKRLDQKLSTTGELSDRERDKARQLGIDPEAMAELDRKRGADFVNTSTGTKLAAKQAAADSAVAAAAKQVEVDTKVTLELSVDQDKHNKATAIALDQAFAKYKGILATKEDIATALNKAMTNVAANRRATS